MIRKCVPVLLIVIILLCACASEKPSDPMPTGYSSTGVHQPQIMYNGIVFYYQATGYDDELPSTFQFVGTVEKNDDNTPPTENWYGSLVTAGNKIYADSSCNDCIYLESEQGFAKFTARES